MKIQSNCPDQISPWFLKAPSGADCPGWVRDVFASGMSGGLAKECWHPMITHVVVEESATSSQFDRLITAGPLVPDGTITLALQGRGFHGQHGRPWRAHAGNIHLSAVFHPDADARTLGVGLTMVPAVAVLRTLRKFHADVPGTGIKWVNDILIRFKKVSGVITSTVLQGGRVQTVVFGIGLNVETIPEVDAAPLVPPGSLNHCWETALTWQEVAPVLIESLAVEYQNLLTNGMKPTFESYRADSLVLGHIVKVYKDDPTCSTVSAEGRVTALNADLSLQIDSSEDPIRYGRVVLKG